MPNITKSFVEKLEARKDNYAVWDDKVAGFGVRVAPTGRRTYILKYRLNDGRQRRRKIGIHGNITCEQARKTALKWHGLIADGHDPSADVTDVKNSPTISQLCDRFIAEHASIHKKPLGLDLDKTAIRKHIKPKLGNLKTISVTKADIQKFHLSMKDTPTHANRILRILSKMFNLAEDWGLRPSHSNPVTHIVRYKEEHRERFLSDEEILSLVKILDECEKDKSETPHFISLIRLLLLTGARLREIMHAKWEWVHFDTGLLMLPDSKTGKKIIHLSPSALLVLDKIPKIKGNPYIIVGNVEKQPLISPQKSWKRIKERATVDLLKDDEIYGEVIEALTQKYNSFPTYKELCDEAKNRGIDKPIGMADVRMHDLRHTYASICVKEGMSLQMVAKLLGHARASTSERYAHLAHDPISNAAAQVGESIINLKKSGSHG